MLSPRVIAAGFLVLAGWLLATGPGAVNVLHASSDSAAAALAAAGDAGSRLPRLYSLLVTWRGTTTLERYYHGTRPTSLADIKSASKSVLSALVGIAIDRGLLKGVSQPIASSFPN
jgi:CubicO group peptidase (beta-lactamase class C family)